MDRRIDGQTNNGKTIYPDLSMRGHKKEKMLVTSHFLLFPQCFPLSQKQFQSSELHLIFHLQKAFKLQSNICASGKELTFTQMTKVWTWLTSSICWPQNLTCLNPCANNHGFLWPLRKKPFENTVRKGENAGNQHFLLFSQCFLPYWRKISQFEPHWNCRLQMLLT